MRKPEEWFYPQCFQLWWRTLFDICWAESSWKRLKLVSRVSKCPVKSPILWLQGESPWGRELDCYTAVLIDDMDEFDLRQRKFSSELEKWMLLVNLFFFFAEMWGQEQQLETWREFLKPCKKWQEYLCWTLLFPPNSSIKLWSVK